jgi:hypothetical protein
LDLPVAPTIVLERPAPCSDAAKAEELLRKALAPSVAPRGAWKVTLRFERSGGELVAQGEIEDEAEAPVAHRALKESTQECSALARAVGVWASLVLDAEVDRAAHQTPPAPLPPPDPAIAMAPPDHDKPPPEAQLFLKHDDGERTIELGVTYFLMGGTGAGAVAGPSLFTVIESGHGWFLRPTLALGRSIQSLTPTNDVYATWGATRFDACGRIPGLYLERRGIQLDVCGGGELGFIHFDAPSSVPASAPGAPPPDRSGRTTPFFALGPSIGFRGELGSDLSAMVRGVAELNVVRESFADSSGSSVDPGLFIGRLEVGLSWQLR